MSNLEQAISVAIGWTDLDERKRAVTDLFDRYGPASERARLSALLKESAETIGGFVDDPVQAVRLVAYLIGLSDR